MKVRIYRSLLLMGIVSVIVTFILSAILTTRACRNSSAMSCST